MELKYLWWVLALGLGIAEMLTGTLFMLVIALGCAGAGVAAALGAPLWAQFVLAGALSLAGTAWARRNRAALAPVQPAARNPDVHADIGERLQVSAWDASGRARVAFRGSHWDVELAPGEPAVAGEFVVVELSGNRLILARPGPVAPGGA